MSQRQWIHVHLGKKTDGKRKIKPHTSKPGVIGKRLNGFLHEKSVKHVSHPVNTLTDSVPGFKPMPACPCGLVNVLEKKMVMSNAEI